MMKTKRQLVRALLLIGAAVVLALLFRNGRTEAGQTVVMPGEGPIRLRAVTYGTNHVVGSLLGRAVARLPSPLSQWISGWLGRWASLWSAQTAAPSLVVWFDIPATPASAKSVSRRAVDTMLADDSGFVSGQLVFPTEDGFRPCWVRRYVYPVFPRRSQWIEMRFFTNGVGELFEFGRVRFRNPVPQPGPVWPPEPLPAVHRLADVEMTLESFHTGYNYKRAFREDPGRATFCLARADADYNYSGGTLRIRSLANPAEVWVVDGADVSDASGNHARQSSLSADPAGRFFSFSPALWPSEPAWPLRLELKKKAGFTPAEVTVFKGIPLSWPGQTNGVSYSTNCGGLTLTLGPDRPTLLNALPPMITATLFLTNPGLPPGHYPEFLSATTDRGEAVGCGRAAMAGNGGHSLLFSPEARTLDITCAMTRICVMEFLVKPEAASLPASSPLTDSLIH